MRKAGPLPALCSIKLISDDEAFEGVVDLAPSATLCACAYKPCLSGGAGAAALASSAASDVDLIGFDSAMSHNQSQFQCSSRGHHRGR